MKSLYKFPLLLAFILCAFIVTAQKPAEKIPSFQFYRLDGSSFTNSSLAKNQLVFFCFFDVTCSHCQRAIAGINRQYRQFKSTALYLVSLDGKDDIKAFLERFGPTLTHQKNVTVLRDQQNEFIYRFRPQKYPSLFLYSKKHALLLYSDDENSIGKFAAKIKAVSGS